MHAPHDGAACMCTHGLDGDEEHMSSTENGRGRTCSAADADSGRRPRSAVGGTALRIGACVQSAVACTGTELETYAGRAGCFAFLPGSVALLGLRRPEQREQVQWPIRLHMCGGGCDQSARWRRIRRAGRGAQEHRPSLVR